MKCLRFARYLGLLCALTAANTSQAEQSCGFLRIAYAFNALSPEMCARDVLNYALTGQKTAEGWNLTGDLGYVIEWGSVRRTSGGNFNFRLVTPERAPKRLQTLQGWARIDVRPYRHTGYDCSLNYGADPNVAQTNLIIKNATGTRLLVMGQERMPVCSMH